MEIPRIARMMVNSSKVLKVRQSAQMTEFDDLGLVTLNVKPEIPMYNSSLDDSNSWEQDV